MATWLQKLTALGLPVDEEGKARHLLLRKSVDDRDAYVAGPREAALAAIRELLKEGAAAAGGSGGGGAAAAAGGRGATGPSSVRVREVSPAIAEGGGGPGAGGGGGGGPDTGAGSSGSAPKAGDATGPSDPSCSPPADTSTRPEPSGPTSGTATIPMAAGATAAAGRADLLPPGASVRLRFLDELAQGDDGAVFHGTCDGDPAVIKVFTWECCALAAYWRESVAYRALAPLQGSVVAHVLAHGQMHYALRYIAMRPVEGKRLSDCVRPFSSAVTAAALHALQEVQAACPGFVHGDLRLENMLLVPGAGSRGGAAVEAEGASGASPGDASGNGGGGAPRCVLLDFGWSRIDGNEQQREQERAQLQRLLGLAAGG